MSPDHFIKMAFFWVLALFSFVLLPSFSVAQDEPRIDVQITPSTTAPGSIVRYTIQVSTEGNQNMRVLRDPAAQNMQVVGRATDTQISINGGVAQRTLNLTYSLRVPDTVGAYTIDPPLLLVGNQRITPDPVAVRVVPDDEVPRAAAATSRRDDMYVAISHQPQRNPYVGEQIMVSYDLMVDVHQMRVRPQPPSDPPLDAFWVEELGQHVVGRRQHVQVDGRTLEKTPLRVLSLFPLRPGPAVIDSIVVPTARGGVFGWGDAQDVLSEEVVLDVQPLPPGAPDYFGEGNVGNWEFTTRPDTRASRVGDMFIVTATATGDGRPGRARLPPFPDTDDFRFISTSSETQQFVQNNRTMGRKVERHTIMPTREGRLTIPSMTFAYFDPEAGVYRTASSQPITIHVEAGDLPPEPQKIDEVASATRNTAEGADISALLLSRLRPLHEVDLTAPVQPGKKNTSLLWIFTLLPILGLVSIAIARPLGRRIAQSRSPRQARQRVWSEVETLLDKARTSPAREGYELVLQALRLVMVELRNVPPGAFTDRELPLHLEAKGVAPDVAQAIGRIVETCTRHRFAPDTSYDSRVPGELLEAWTTLLARVVDSSSNTTPSPSSTLLVLTLFIAAALTALLAPTPVQATELSQPLDQAFELASEQSWNQAATIFDSLAREHPEYPILAFNAGTTLLKAGNLPMGRLHLERAGLNDPGNRNIAANLDLARELVELSSMRPGRSTVASKEVDLQWWRVAAGTSPSTLSWATVLLLWIALGAYALLQRSFSAPIRRALVATAIGSLVLATGLMLARGAQRHIIETYDVAVVVSENPALHQGPSPHAGRIPDALHPGMMVRLGDGRRDWTEVRLDEGKTGWVLTSSLALVKGVELVR